MRTLDKEAIEFSNSFIPEGDFQIEVTRDDIESIFFAVANFVQLLIDSNIDLPPKDMPVLVELKRYGKVFNVVASIFVCENGNKMWYDNHSYFKTEHTRWRHINY